MLTDFIGEDQVMFVAPQLTGRQLPTSLFCLLGAQSLYDRWRERNNAVFAVLRFIDKVVFPASTLLFLKLAAYRQAFALPVYVLPFQAEKLRLS